VVWYGIPAESKFNRALLKYLPLLIKLGLSNEVQNFLYLSKTFDSSHTTEGIDTNSVN
jgi:hypothetical protein